MVALTGITMFVVGGVYGGAGQAKTSGTVDLPAATALRPHVYPDGSLSPDYKDAAVMALQTALEQAITDYKVLEEHDAMIHRGGCVPWEKK